MLEFLDNVVATPVAAHVVRSTVGNS